MDAGHARLPAQAEAVRRAAWRTRGGGDSFSAEDILAAVPLDFLPACLLPTACDYNGLDCFDPLGLTVQPFRLKLLGGRWINILLFKIS